MAHGQGGDADPQLVVGIVADLATILLERHQVDIERGAQNRQQRGHATGDVRPGVELLRHGQVVDHAHACPATLQQSTSIHSVAVSLGWPYATVHRLVKVLIERGALVHVGKGVAMPNTPAAAAATIAFLHDLNDILTPGSTAIRQPILTPESTKIPAGSFTLPK